MFAVYLTAFGILLVATATVAGSSLLSVYSDAKDEESHFQSSDGESSNHLISFGNDDGMLWQAIFFPIMASISLLTMFFFFQYMQYLLFVFLTSAAFGAVHQLMLFAIEHFSLAQSVSSKVKNWLISIVAGVIVIGWIMTGYWIFHNILCISLGILFIHTLRFPSFKIVTLLLVLLLIYDGFWVFYSEFFFHKNVMVEVAKKTVTNPVKDVVTLLKAPKIILSYISPSIELPIKLLFPVVYTIGDHKITRMMMLGLGDIILPGAAVNFALRCDLLWLKWLHIELSSKKTNLELIETTRLLSEHERNVVDNEVFDSTKNDTGSNKRIFLTDGLSAIEKSNRRYSNTDEEVGFLLQRNDSKDTLGEQFRVFWKLFRPFRLSFVVIQLPLFMASCGSYFFGLFLAFFANFWFNSPQPALIYIVPSMLIAISILAFLQNKFSKIWHGLQQWEKEEMARHHQL